MRTTHVTEFQGNIAHLEAKAMSDRMIDELLSELQQLNEYKIAGGQVSIWSKKQISSKGTPFINITPNFVPGHLCDRFIAGVALFTIDYLTDGSVYRIGSHQIGAGGSSSTSEIGQFGSKAEVVRAVKGALAKL
jgi:hypothetical protein